MSLAAVLQHVQVLEACGLVRTEKAGRTRTCSIDPAVLHTAEAWISDRRAMVERRLDRLGDYLASTAEPLRTLSPDQEPGGTRDHSQENR